MIKAMSRSATGRRVTASRRPIPIQAAMIQEARATPDNKIHLVKAMQSGAYEITTSLDERTIESHTAMELYEMAYGGSADPFQGSAFEKERMQENALTTDLIRDINVVSSIYKCPRPSCGYTRILVRQEQLSSGDESATTLYRCTRCNFQWSNTGRG